MILDLPHQFSPRSYQKDFYRAFFVERKKRIVLVWHRRAGKDLSILNALVMAALERVGNYFYLFPEQEQVRKAIWDGIDNEGKRFIDYIPSAITKSRNVTQMSITLINGSIIKFTGSDRYNALMGTNPVGIIFSEYSIQTPAAWDFTRPMVRANDGWVIFPYTPRGKNHGFKLYEMAKKNEKWYCDLRGVEDTRRNDGSFVISQEDIEEERKEGMAESLIKQEYYCSFEAANVGAVYEKEAMAVIESGRLKSFVIDRHIPVYTAWDIGYSDATAIWLMQPCGYEIRLIGYFEDNFKGPEHFVELLKEFARKNNIRYADDFLPHDAFARDFKTNGKTVAEMLFSFGRRVARSPSIKVTEGIASVRYLFPRLVFHEANCSQGWEAIKAYRYEWKEKDRVYAKNPKHDWASHGADALRMLCASWDDRFTQDKVQKVSKLASWEYRL